VDGRAAKREAWPAPGGGLSGHGRTDRRPGLSTGYVHVEHKPASRDGRNRVKPAARAMNSGDEAPPGTTYLNITPACGPFIVEYVAVDTMNVTGAEKVNRERTYDEEGRTYGK
jgi:hypothetical protein